MNMYNVIVLIKYTCVVSTTSTEMIFSGLNVALI